MDSSLRSEWQEGNNPSASFLGTCLCTGEAEEWAKEPRECGRQVADKGGIGVRGALAVREWSGVQAGECGGSECEAEAALAIITFGYKMQQMLIWGY